MNVSILLHHKAEFIPGEQYSHVGDPRSLEVKHQLYGSPFAPHCVLHSLPEMVSPFSEKSFLN